MNFRETRKVCPWLVLKTERAARMRMAKSIANEVISYKVIPQSLPKSNSGKTSWVRETAQKNEALKKSVKDWIYKHHLNRVNIFKWCFFMIKSQQELNFSFIKSAKARFMRFFLKNLINLAFFQALKLETFFSDLHKNELHLSDFKGAL